MADASVPVGLGLLGIGGALVASGITGNSLGEILGGNFTRKAGDTNTSAASASSASTPSATGASPANIEKLFTTMDSMVGRPYNWGGGHGRYSANDNWDCSGAVSYALHSAGFLDGGPRNSGEFMSWGASGAGRYFTVFSNPVHVFIRSEFGNRKGQVWSADHPGNGGETNWRNGNTFPTAGYIARHYPGL